MPRLDVPAARKNILINLVLFVVTTLAALVASLIGLGWIGGRDIGFAGAALWYVAVPASAIGMILALAVALLAFKGPGLRRGAFVTVSVLTAFGTAALAMHSYMYAMLHSGEDNLVYIRAKDYAATIEIAAPAEAVATEPFAVRATLRHGPWDRVRYGDLGKDEYKGRSGTYRSEPPAPVNTAAARGEGLSWRIAPHAPMHSAEGGSSDAVLWVIRSPGTFQLWASMFDMPEVKSNVVTISVRPSQP